MTGALDPAMQVVLPWPPKELSPNARVYFRKKAPITAAYRAEAFERSSKDRLDVPAEGEVHLRIWFMPPDRRRRDLDNMLASVKAGLDGFADAHEVNDQRFAFTLHRRDPVKGGLVILELAA